MKLKTNILLILSIFTFIINCSSGSNLKISKDFSSRLSKIDSLRTEGKISEAIDSLNAVIKNDRRAAWAYNELGEIYARYRSVGYNKMSEKNYKNALRYDKNNPKYLLNYGLLKFNMEDFYKAEKLFERSLKYDPHNSHVLMELVNLYIRRKSNTDMKEIEKYYAGITDNDSSFYDVLLGLTQGFLKTGGPEKAEMYISELLKLYPEDSKVNLYYSDFLAAREDYKQASLYYIKGLRNLENMEELQKRYLDVRDIMTAGEKEAYEFTSDFNKGKFLIDFWRKKDLNIVTEKNERLIEHLKRLRHVKYVYSSNRKSGYDDRGKVYLKYGKPDNKHIDPVADDVRKANESWAYPSVHPDLSYDFVEDFTYYENVPDLTYAAQRTSRRIRGNTNLLIKYGRGMYRERAYLSNQYARIASGSSSLIEIAAERIAAENESPVEQYIPEFEYKLLDVQLLVFQYREENDRTGLAVFTGIDSVFAGMIEERFAILNQAYKRIAATENRAFGFLSGAKYILCQKFRCEPGFYAMGGEVMTEDKGFGRNFKFEVDTRSYKSMGLNASDLMFAADITQSGIEDGYMRNGLTIKPTLNSVDYKSTGQEFYPIIRKDEKLYVYFEIYNLAYSREGKTKYRLEYTVKQEDKKGGLITRGIKAIGRLFGEQQKGTISLSYVREGNRKDTFEYVQLDLSELNSALSILEVEIQDLISNQKQKIEKVFNIK